MTPPRETHAPGPPATLTPHALRVLERRYLVHDERGRAVESPEDMFLRVAANVAQADAALPFDGRRDPDHTAGTFHRMIASLEFLPNSPTLMNAGRDLQQLCACFVLPVHDSMEGIFDALKNAARSARSCPPSSSSAPWTLPSPPRSFWPHCPSWLARRARSGSATSSADWWLSG